MKIKNRRVKTPTVLQMEAVECGAACLCIVLAYHNRYISLEELRYQCDVNRDGSKASNILKAARLHNLIAKGFKKEVDEVLNLEFPVIIHWNFNHFVVLEGVKNNVVYINDPAQGHRKVSLEEFTTSFTGIVLSFTKDSNFQPKGEENNVLTSVNEKIKNYKVGIIFIMLLGLFLVIPGLLIPVFSRIFIDEILIKGATDWVYPLLVGIILTGVLRAILEWLRAKYLLKIRNKLSLISSASFFMHILKLPISFISQRYIGEIGSRVQINDSVATLLTGKLATNFLNLIVVVFYILIMLQYDIVLTCVGVGISLLNVLALKSISDLRTEQYRKYLQSNGRLLGVSMSGLQMIETLKAIGRENDFFARWSGYFAKVINSQQRLSSLTIYFNSIPTIISSISTIAILVIGSIKVMNGVMTIGMLVAFQSLMESFYTPISGLISLGGELQTAQGDLSRLNDIEKSEPDRIFKNDAIARKNSLIELTHKLEGYIEFRNITFGYSRLNAPLIDNFSLKVKPGERVALVGGSGSGKSTIAKLLAGLYEPWSGNILLDGKPIHLWPRQIINNSMSMVDQDVYMFEGTVKDSVTLWDNTIPYSSLIRATKDAEIHDVISGKQNGYYYNLTEEGRNFSGGQRQRLEIARALAINPSILILDEATSALDSLTEKQIDDNLKKRKCALLIVAHRLSTIRDCNEIIVLSKGKIVERGTHEELIALQGEYWNLIKS